MLSNSGQFSGNPTETRTIEIGLPLLSPAFGYGFRDREDAAIAKHEGEIQGLRRELDRKDGAIVELRNKVKILEEENNNLRIQHNSKSEEIKTLKERIQKLEDEKSDLEEQLSSVERKLKRVEDEVKNLSKSKERQDEENVKLREELQKVQYNLKVVKDDLIKENETLKQEVKEARDYRAVAIPGQAPRQQPELSEGLALMNLGELCLQIQGCLYQKVLPNFYTRWKSYKVKAIDKDIKKLLKTEDERDKAREQWEILKSKLNWNEDFEDVLRSLQDSRNVEAHPKLDEKNLRYFAQFLDEQGSLKGYLSLERVNNLIDVWKRLTSTI